MESGAWESFGPAQGRAGAALDPGLSGIKDVGFKG